MDDQSMTSEKIVKDIQESIKVRHNIEQQDNKPMSFFQFPNDIRSREGKDKQIMYNQQILNSQQLIQNIDKSCDTKYKREVKHHFNLFRNVELYRIVSYSNYCTAEGD